MVNIDKIKSLARSNGIKLKFICSQLGVAESYFGDVKAGKTSISDERLCKIADILNTTPEYLRDETDDPTKKKPLTEPDEKLDGNILIIRGRDGRYIRKVLTDKEIESFETLFKNLPDLPEDV